MKNGDLVGQMIGGSYEVLERAGRGSMGIVYRARNLRTGANVALKVMHPALAANRRDVQRFLREAQNAGRLQHPNIVNVMDRGELHDGCPYLVMEYLNGCLLSDAVKAEGALAHPRAVRIATQIVKGLGEAHGQGLVHRDLKPENVMLVDRFGEPEFVKLLDFGIARPTETAQAGTVVMGTPKYMAPEQWSSTVALDARSDLYSLGCVLFFMLTGRPPFELEAADPRRAVQLYHDAHLRQHPKSVREAGAEACPPALADLIGQLLAKRPAERPDSAERVLVRLERIMGRAGDHDDDVPIPAGGLDLPNTVLLSTDSLTPPPEPAPKPDPREPELDDARTTEYDRERFGRLPDAAVFRRHSATPEPPPLEPAPAPPPRPTSRSRRPPAAVDVPTTPAGRRPGPFWLQPQYVLAMIIAVALGVTVGALIHLLRD